MRVKTIIVLSLILSSLIGEAAGQSSAADRLREDIEFARRKVYPALVNISVVVRTFQEGRAVRVPAAGSGTIVSPAGHVVTNYHVAEQAVRITCTLPSGEAIAAEVVAHDPPSDISLLKLRLEERRNPGEPLPFATLGDSDALKVGDYVLAVGNPLALSSSMTLGIVSNTKRVFTDFTGTQVEDLEIGPGQRTGMFTRWIQHDALILPGNSGGPLLNLRGEIVGVNTRGGAGVGFATPSNLVSRVVNQILTFGAVRRGWIGITPMPVAKMGLDQGILVGFVEPGSPAHKSGIEAGDVILSVDSQPVTCRFFEELPLFLQLIAERAPGTPVEVAVARGAERRTVSAVLARMEDFIGEEVELKEFGISVQEITGPMALVRQYPDDEGVLITGLRPGHPFEEARPRVQAGDVLLALDGRRVKDLAAFREAMRALSPDQEVAVGYRRDREELVTVVKFRKVEREKPGRELPKAWLGIKSQVLTPPVAKALGLEGRKGFRVTEVFPWTTASRDGLKSGDIIVAVNGEPLTASRPQDEKDLKNAVEELPIGRPVALEVLRDGKPVTIQVAVEESPASALDARKAKDEVLEFSVREVTFMDRVEKHWAKDVKGVLVTECVLGGWAGVAGLRIGDLLMSVDRRPTGDIDEFKKALEEAAGKKARTVSLFVRRGWRTTWLFVEPEWDAGSKGR